MAGAYLIVAWAISQDPRAFWWLDQKLAREVNTWKSGAEPPAALLHFPDGPPRSGICAFSAPPTVHDYISRIQNEALLKSLLLHPQADANCIRATARQLIELKGVPAVREILMQLPKHGQQEYVNEELVILRQLLNSRYAKLRVASIDKTEVGKDVAEKALTQLQAMLEAKESWEHAYGKVSEDLPGPMQRGTSLRYAYHGMMSPTGFDLFNPAYSHRFEPEHLRKIFENKPGVHRFETKDRYWLYQVEAIYEQ